MIYKKGDVLILKGHDIGVLIAGKRYIIEDILGNNVIIRINGEDVKISMSTIETKNGVLDYISVKE